MFTAIGHQGTHDSQAWITQRKQEGVRKGFPDMMLLVPSGKYNGLFIELKRPNGKATKEQKEWIENLNYYDYKAVIIKTDKPSEVIAVIKDYLGWG